MSTKIEGLDVSGSSGNWNVSQEIDLSDYGQFDEATSYAIGQEIIDVIKKRTEDNKNVHGGSLAGYSESYIETEKFDAFNKSAGDVDMTLTGEMMSDLDVIEFGDNKIVIGFTDDLSNAKAHGHMTGSIGKKREFFGVNLSELSNIMSKYESAPTDESLTAFDILSRLKTADKSTQSALDLFGISGDIFGFNDEDL